MPDTAPFMKIEAADLAAKYPELTQYGAALEAMATTRHLAMHRGVSAWHCVRLDDDAPSERVRVSTHEELEAQLRWVSGEVA